MNALCFRKNFELKNHHKSKTNREGKAMENYELLANEVVLYEGVVTSKNYKGTLQLTLT